MLEHVVRRRLPLPERGVEIALLDWGGDGPLALLHHANGFCAATWDLVAQPLRERFRVVGMDGRGHGDSSRPAGDAAFAWREFGSDLAAVARVLTTEVGGKEADSKSRPTRSEPQASGGGPLPGKVALGLGHSFGGTAMLLAAAAEPALFERLVLVDPVLHAPPGADALDPQRSERAGNLIERTSRRRSVFPDRDAARESWLEKDLFAAWDPRAFELYLREGLADRPDGQVELKCATETEAAVFGQGFFSDVWSPTQDLPVPVLILWARRGDFPRPVYEAFAARLADARVEDVDAGHLVPMERPDLVVEAVLAFTASGAHRQRSTG